MAARTPSAEEICGATASASAALLSCLAAGWSALLSSLAAGWSGLGVVSVDSVGTCFGGEGGVFVLDSGVTSMSSAPSVIFCFCSDASFESVVVTFFVFGGGVRVVAVSPSSSIIFSNLVWDSLSRCLVVNVFPTSA